MSDCANFGYYGYRDPFFRELPRLRPVERWALEVECPRCRNISGVSEIDTDNWSCWHCGRWFNSETVCFTPVEKAGSRYYYEGKWPEAEGEWVDRCVCPEP